jgi:TRAP transporter TAXI family solute receptor
MSGREGDTNAQPSQRGSRRLATVLSGIAFILSILPCISPASADEPRFFRIGTAGTTGTYFQIGGAIANAISNPPGSPNCQKGGTCGVPDLIAVAQATQGSVENVDLINRSQVEAALAQADIASWAYRGTGIFKGKPPITSLRAIASLYAESLHLVVAQAGGIEQLKDLRGKRIGLGEKESGTVVDARIVLEAAGLSEHDIKPDYSRLGDAASGVRENMLDGFFLLGGYPVPAVAELAASTSIRLVPIGDDVLDRLKKRYPYFSRSDIPADTYEGVAQPTVTLGIPALLIVGADVPEELVHDITKSLWNDATRQLLASRSAAGKRVAFGHALDGIDIPLHPGAERFYREMGVTKDNSASQ